VASDPFGYGAQWGYYTDVETGLVALTYRYYDSGTGRFLNRDPIGTSGGMNLYGYVGNSPTRGVDPSGLTEYDMVPPGMGQHADSYVAGLREAFRNPWFQGAIGGMAGFASYGSLPAATGAAALFAGTASLSGTGDWQQAVGDAATVGCTVGTLGQAGQGAASLWGTMRVPDTRMVELYHFTSGGGARGIMGTGEIYGSRGLWRPWGGNDVYFGASPSANWFKRTMVWGLPPSHQEAIVLVQVPASSVLWRPWGIRIVPGPVPFK
jgi:RHS repeat-associated protein